MWSGQCSDAIFKKIKKQKQKIKQPSRVQNMFNVDLERFIVFWS